MIQIYLSSSYSLIVHLKMTGQLIFRSNKTRFGGGHPTDSFVNDLPDKSTRVVMKFKDSSALYFNDQRKFGWMILIPTIEVDSIDFFRNLGPSR